MSHLDAIEDAATYCDKLEAQQEAQRQAEAVAIVDFMKACQRLDANALADFAPLTTDWDAVRAGPRAVGAPMPMRVPTLSELMSDSLDLGNGPSTTEVMQLVLSLAFSSDAQANQAHRARQLLASMAATYAAYNVLVED